MSLDLSDRATRMRVNKRFREKGVPAKVCGKCFVVKGYEAFSAWSRGADGRMPHCRPCSSDRGRAWRAANREKTVAYDRQRYTAEPERRREYARRWTAANPDRKAQSNRQWHAENRERISERKRTYYTANRDRIIEASRRWAAENADKVRDKTHRRRAAIAEATTEPFTARDLRRDWEDHDLYDCFFCGGTLTDGYEVEHFYALSKGGPHALFNLVPSCAPCNHGAGGKGTKEPWGYLREALAEQGTDLDACVELLVRREG
ncbi:HNH endonuclease [Streptomyces luteogriseus]|uniref:HNH endonuclease n=1 Tax=Streptomyces luteogriseus TaxID=68233 RepID=UPI00379F6478